MKKIELLLIAMAMIFTSYAQITQEQIIVNNNIHVAELIELENSGMKYYYQDYHNLTIKIYNIDHSIYRTIQLDTVALGLVGYPNINEFSVYFISENLFDNDNNVELLVYINVTSSDWQNSIKKTAIINDDGSILFEALNQAPPKDDDAIPQFPNWIRNTDQGTKMILSTYNQNGNDSLFIYSIPGTVPCYTCDQTNKIHNLNNKSQKLSNYPNPAKDYTIIKYEIPEGENKAEIQIYSINGQLIKTYEVDNTFNDLRISTNELSNGTYIYNIKTKKEISKGEKLIISK